MMSEAEIRYSNQSKQLNRLGITFGKYTAARLVGGEKRLADLYSAGKVRIEFRGKGKGKWFCNAADVLRNVRVD